MHFAVDIAPFGEFADPMTIARFGRAAEEAGWDGISTWDTTGVSMGTAAPDPFLALAAVASATERLRLILSVAALPRRRPQLVAQSAATLDVMSGGRFVLGVGAGGDPPDFDAFGEAAPASERVATMDASLAVIDPWLRGVPARLDLPGATAVTIGPRSIQRPRPPIWLGGMRPGALRRAAMWDGWIAIGVADDGSSMALDPVRLAGMIATTREGRQRLGRSGAPFDIAVFGLTTPGDRDTPASFGDAGATWWLESLSGLRGSVDDVLAIIATGPPR